MESAAAGLRVPLSAAGRIYLDDCGYHLGKSIWRVQWLVRAVLGPGIKGPPMHTQNALNVHILVQSGELGVPIGSTRRVCHAGDSITLTPNDPPHVLERIVHLRRALSGRT